MSKSSATIKHHMSTLVVHLLIVMAPKQVLVPHRAHSSIVNSQPSFPATAVSVLVEHVDRIVTAACGLAVVEEHPIERIVRRI